MGCGGSKTPAASTMYEDLPDATTGLTLKDEMMIVNCWKLISNRSVLKQNAVVFFMILFETYPHIQDRFVLFRDKPLEELRTSPKMKAHAVAFFFAVSAYIENLDDPETLVGLMHKIVIAHIGRKIPSDDFDKLRIVFLNFVKYILGDQYTAEDEQAWDKLLRTQTAVYKQIEEEMSRKLNQHETEEMDSSDL